MGGSKEGPVTGIGSVGKKKVQNAGPGKRALTVSSWVESGRESKVGGGKVRKNSESAFHTIGSFFSHSSSLV